MEQCQIGVLGLGVMGSALAENFLNCGFFTALYSREESERERFRQKRADGYCMAETPEQFVRSLKKPRKIIMMITAGPAVDMVMEELRQYLEPGDIVVDGGNSYYPDTNRRTEAYAEAGLHFVGMGVSGGERGALEGPSMMVGGSRQAFEELRPYLQAAAAKAGEICCCDHVGEAGAGHYVKMVHNGIEYAVIQLIAETYQYMKEAGGMTAPEIGRIFQEWEDSELASYLVEITAAVLQREEDGEPLVEKILPVARQKGTGRWTLMEGIERGVYIPTIYEAVSVRQFSEYRYGRNGYGTGAVRTEREMLDSGSIRSALHLAILCCYAQGLTLIQKASDEFGWKIDLAAAVSLWKGGCIIRAEMLQDIVEVLRSRPEPDNILFAEQWTGLEERRKALELLVSGAASAKVPVPALASALAYYDCCYAEELPLNLVQGLRDCFGAHTYERKDREGVFHTEWEQK